MAALSPANAAPGPEGLILLTGATGYVGGRLLPILEASGRRVRCLVRRPEFLQARVALGTEVVPGDVLDFTALARALGGVHAAYYLVHSLAARGDYAAADRRAALAFGAAARQAGVERIIYLGGLGRQPGLSRHLASRQEVGEALRASGVPTLELRASIVIGSGSLSFEMVRALVEQLPVMTTPRWVRTPAQPIAIEDVLAYLLASLELPLESSRVYEIGGAEVVSYEGIMREYARQRGLRRWIVPVPLLSPGLSGLWLALVTPLYHRVGRQLIEGVRNPTVVTDPAALRDFPVRPMGIRQAVLRALDNEDREVAATRWSGALGAEALAPHWGGAQLGTRRVDSRERFVPRDPAQVFRQVQCIGGENGWYGYDWLWGLRGLVDQLAGGVGLRRGRRDPRCVLVGDTVDFWRVEALEQDRLLRLAAEMRAPGRAWLQFEVTPAPGGCLLRQTAIFDPVGLGGLLYWYALTPLHGLIFAGMIRGIARAALSDRHEKRFHDQAERLRSPERLARLEVPEVVRLSLEGATIGSVLDAGTGTGIFAEAFAARGMRVTGIDVNEELLRLARATVPGVEFQAADLERLPMAERSFDLVFLGLVLHETGDPLHALREARRLARVRVAVLEWPRRKEPQGPPLGDRLPGRRILRLARTAGFSAVERLALQHLDLYRLTL